MAPLWVGAAIGETRVHALVIGNNGMFPDAAAEGDAGRKPLLYADDDAAAVYELLSTVTATAHLLTLMDSDTQALFPELVKLARVPTEASLQEAIASLAETLERERTAGHRTAVLVFYSGHGSVSYDGGPALALSGGKMDQAFLYDRLLAQLPADSVHLLIDACHAEAVVRPRDREGHVVQVETDQANAVLLRTTLARFPHVGVVVAASSGAQAHEWDAIGHGIFTHELLSALRGAADVNLDRRVEYSEVYAFMSAANRSVDDPRARLKVVARPPSTNRRIPLVDWTHARLADSAWLTGVSGHSGRVQVRDRAGRAILTFHGSRDFAADLLLPTDTTILLRGREREALFRARPGQNVHFSSLAFGDATGRPRDFAEAIRDGLFASGFGPAYYMGFVDHSPEFISVDFPDDSDAPSAASPTPPAPRTDAPSASSSAFTTEGAHHALIGGPSLSTPVAQSLAVSAGGQLGRRPIGRSGWLLSVDVLAARDGEVSEWTSSASAGWAFGTHFGGVAAWGGLALGGGAILQRVEDVEDRATALAFGAPLLGLSTQFTPRIGVFGELQLRLMGYVEDARTRTRVAPLGNAGVTWKP